MRSLLALPLFLALAAGSSLQFDRYWSAEEIRIYLNELAAEFPTYVSISSFGITSENRQIWGLNINENFDLSRPLVIVESGLRAREWVSPMVACSIMHELVEHHYEFEELLDRVNFLIIPLANPDGYEYSRTANRAWIKSRTPNGNGCFGTDLNRNFGYRWNTVGGSTDPCSDEYVGTGAFSAPETTALRNMLQSNSNRLALYLSIQAAGQMVLYPYGHSAMTNPDNVVQLRSLANDVARTLMNQNGKIFTAGGAGLLQSPASGSSIDYVAGTNHTDLVFTIKTRSGGNYGYDIPEAELAEVLSETTHGFLTLAEYVAGQ
ncbi:zinc carboxypeptidase A 1-like [Anopheles bellator]|uniref:zinc carboxypeptidase A 1-like n=1 Tax=Anopheles bellator TaxID=139047 RepID=UPI002647BFCB|nr:zinc carboxypeptidase A 1-like [Anopheles bellator]